MPAGCDLLAVGRLLGVVSCRDADDVEHVRIVDMRVELTDASGDRNGGAR